ncbi:methyltransferase [Streptomyces sp. NPDC006307]|uniref:methyltransferase n=1 Tax=Streptomyces sp. NPDC006307 TaxID=3156748 RepID=UPI0033B5D08C
MSASPAVQPPSVRPDIPPEETQRVMRTLLMGMPWVGQAVYAVAKVGVPDALAGGPLPVAELADRVGADADALFRFCRALESLGLLEITAGKEIGLAPGGHLLRSDAPGALRHFVIVNGEESFRAWAEVLHSLRTGRPAFEKVYGTGHFAYMAEHPEAAESFNAMAGSGTAPAVLERCDVADASVVADIGGATGVVLASVLARLPEARGILQDLPQAVADAPAVLRKEGVEERCEIVGASFFDQVATGADVYILCRVLHDWNDEDALRILSRVREAMRPDSRLVVVDNMIPATAGFHPGKLADLQMLVILGGKERTLGECKELLERAGFRTVAEHLPEGPGPRGESAVEAVPA